MNLVASRSATAIRTDRVLLEGPHSRRRELWLVLRAFADFIQGFRTLHFVGPCVTVFGSARYGESHPLYELGHWRPLQDLLRHLAAARTIDQQDLELLLVTDSVSTALEHIQRHAVEPFGLVRRHLRPSSWLGERTVTQRLPTAASRETHTPIAPGVA